MSNFNAQDQLDTTMARIMSWEVFEWIRGYKATHHISEGLSSDFVMHVTSVVWAFDFAKVLQPEFAEPVQDVLRIVGCEMDHSRHGSQKMLRSHSGPAEPM